MYRQYRHVVAAFAALALALVALNTPGQEDEDPLADYRSKYMDSLGNHIGGAYLIVSGQVQYRAHLASHARALAEQTRHILELFPEGSAGDTRALPAIWENWQQFEAAASKAERAAAEFHAVVEADAAPAELVERFKALGGACKGCHEKFRAEED